MILIQGKCKNCGDSVISQDNGVSWVHGIIVQNRPLLTPINSLCRSPKGQSQSERKEKYPDDDFIPDNWEEVLYLSE